MRRETLELLASWAKTNIFVAACASLVFESGIAGLANALFALLFASYGLYMATTYGVDDDQ